MIYNIRFVVAVFLISCTSQAGEIHNLARQGEWISVFQMLDEGMASVNEPDENGDSLLDIAEDADERIVVRELRERFLATKRFGIPPRLAFFQWSGVHEIATLMALRPIQKLLEWFDCSPALGLDALPAEILRLVYGKLDPVERNKMRLLSRRHKDVVDLMRNPRNRGGMGLTDLLPIVATFKLQIVGGHPVTIDFQEVVLRGRWLFVPAKVHGEWQTFIVNTLKHHVHEIRLGRDAPRTLDPNEIFCLPNFYDSAVALVRKATGSIERIVNLKSASKHAAYRGRFLYVTHHESEWVSAVEMETEETVAEIPVGRDLGTPVVAGRFVCLTVGATQLGIIDTHTNQLIGNTRIAAHCSIPVTRGGFLYIISPKIWPHVSLSVIKIASQTVVARLAFRAKPQRAVAAGASLYVLCDDGIIIVVDISGYI